MYEKMRGNCIMIGITPIDLDINSSIYNNCGCYYSIFNNSLYSGSPHDYNGLYDKKEKEKEDSSDSGRAKKKKKKDDSDSEDSKDYRKNKKKIIKSNKKEKKKNKTQKVLQMKIKKRRAKKVIL